MIPGGAQQRIIDCTIKKQRCRNDSKKIITGAGEPKIFQIKTNISTHVRRYLNWRVHTLRRTHLADTEANCLWVKQPYLLVIHAWFKTPIKKSELVTIYLSRLFCAWEDFFISLLDYTVINVTLTKKSVVDDDDKLTNRISSFHHNCEITAW